VSSFPKNRGDAFSLLCACGGANLDEARIRVLANWSFDGFDWDDLLGLAEHHGVLSMAARNLTAHVRSLPPKIDQRLRTAYAANLRRNLWFAAELARIVQHFASQQLNVLPFKGPVLAQSAYADLGLRSFSDLDLLIARADFARAKGALAELGYTPSETIAPAVERLWLRTGYERSFDGGAGKHLVELQWNILPYFYAVDARGADFEFEDLLARAGRISLGMAEVPLLAPEDSLLALCLHAAKHLWTRLAWVADIAESLRRGIDIGRVISRARALGVLRIVGVSFWLAERLLGSVIPEDARNVVARDSNVSALGEECAARLARAETYDFESTDYFREILKLRERTRDRARYLWRLIWTPGPGDIAAIKLPESLFPVYRAVRIGRVLGKSLSRGVRGQLKDSIR
jgi:hypothetical protein